MTTATSPRLHEEAVYAEEEAVHAEKDWRNLPDDRRYEMVDGESGGAAADEKSALNSNRAKSNRSCSMQHIEDGNLPFWVGIGASFRLGLSSANFRIPGFMRNCGTTGNAGYRR